MRRNPDDLSRDDLRDAVFVSAPHGYLILDPQFTIIDVNQTYLDLTETTREHLLGREMFDAFPDNPDDPMADGVRNLRLSLETALATGQRHTMALQKYDIPVTNGTAGGFEERYWKPLNTPVLRDGRVIALIHHVIDVTEETIAKRDQAIRLRSAQRLNDLAFWEYDPRTSTAYISRAFARMFGLPEQEGTISAESCFARVHEDDLAEVHATFNEAAGAPDHTSVAFTHRLNLPNGNTRWITSQGELVRDHRDALPRFVCVSLDVTVSKRREDELARALADRDRLLAQKESLLGEVNHRIKNSLQLVASMLSMDARRAASDDVRARLDQAAARVQAVTSVHEMLYRSNEVSTVEFGAYLRELCATLSAGDADREHVELVCEPTEVHLSTDTAIALALIVNELVTNALKHAFPDDRAGRIVVTTSMEADAFTLRVADDGIGYASGSKSGLGKRIIEGLVGQLDADFTVNDDSKGHDVEIRMSLT